MLETVLKDYQVDYLINKDYVEIWRNGGKIELNIEEASKDLSMVDIILNDFCIRNPLSVKKSKIQFPEYFITPKAGDIIFVKKLNNIYDAYSMREFIRFENEYIICKLKSGKEVKYDLYQIYVNNNHPFSNFWMNAYQNIVNWSVIEKLIDKNLK
jgi:hypothetical protein